MLLFQGVTATTQWHLSQSVAIYETVQLSEALAGGTAISSTRTAPPVQAALAQLSSSTGDAKALATAPNAQDVILVAAARHDASFFTAEVDVVGNSTTVTLSRFAGAGSPTWTKTFLQTSFADGSLRASDDGSHVVVALVNTTTSASSLQTFDGATGKLVATYAGFKSGDTPCCLTPFTTKGSMAGRVLVAAGATVHVVDIATGKAAWTTDRGYFNAANAISADGQYITYGFLDYSILKWSAATGTYEPAHSATAGGYIANAVAFSPSASAAILGKYNETTARHSVVEQWKLGSSGKPAVGWTYEYADVSAQPLQDTVSAMQFTDDGKQLVLCSWGTASADNPTVRGARSRPLHRIDSCRDRSHNCCTTARALQCWTRKLASCSAHSSRLVLCTTSPSRRATQRRLETCCELLRWESTFTRTSGATAATGFLWSSICQRRQLALRFNNEMKRPALQTSGSCCWRRGYYHIFISISCKRHQSAVAAPLVR